MLIYVYDVDLCNLPGTIDQGHDELLGLAFAVQHDCVENQYFQSLVLRVSGSAIPLNGTVRANAPASGTRRIG